MWNKKNLVLTENGGAQVQDKPTRVTNPSETPIDHMKHKKLQNLNSSNWICWHQRTLCYTRPVPFLIVETIQMSQKDFSISVKSRRKEQISRFPLTKVAILLPERLC